jgi:hypothetical protein
MRDNHGSAMGAFDQLFRLKREHLARPVSTAFGVSLFLDRHNNEIKTQKSKCKKIIPIWTSESDIFRFM